MCGLSALFSSSVQFSSSLVQAMNSVIRHRGPDDEGYFFLEGESGAINIFGGEDTPQNVYGFPGKHCPKRGLGQGNAKGCLAALGHRRLSIIDLSPAGHQPMCTYDGDLWITYNGEIYNYPEIREELVRAGCCFATHSDTEVVLQAYRMWGAGCLHRFNGMFAFLIFDTRKQSLFAARDRFGVKPLYYWRSPQGVLAFASEIKQFTVLPDWEAKLNTQRGYDFLNWGLLDHTHETLFKNVFQLCGGEYLELSLEEVSRVPVIPSRWYALRPEGFHGSLEQAAERFAVLLEDAVRLRLRSDVPVGSCLSGGLDSSSIVCLASRLLGSGSKQKTFSACSHHKRFDERVHIEEVVHQTGVEAYYVYPDVDKLLEESSTVLWHQDEPYPTTSIYAQWLVFKKVKEQHVKVMLDGQGADEQLGGYQGFFGNGIYDLFVKGHWGRMLEEIRAVKTMHPHLRPWPLLLNKFVPDPIRQPIRRWLGKSAAGPQWLDLTLLQAKDCHPCRGSRGNTFFDQSYQQLTQTSLPMLLHFEDRDSMAHSVESRTPFLDYRLVEFNLGLPSDYKVTRGWTKHVMREGMKKVLPSSICWRRDKMGFLTAEEEWVCGERPEEFSMLVEQAIEMSQGVLNQKARALALSVISKEKTYSPVVWRQICFAQWLELFRCSV